MKAVPHKAIWVTRTFKEEKTRIKRKNLKIYAKWLNKNVYHRSSLSRNIAESKDSRWTAEKRIGEQEISWKIYEHIAEFLCQIYSLDLVSSVIARREGKDKLFLIV